MHNPDETGQIDLILLNFRKARFLTDFFSRRWSTMAYEDQLSNTCRSRCLSQRTQQVLVGGKVSMQANVTSGVSPGRVLEPLRFLTYINDLADGVMSLTTRLFVDDCALNQRISSFDDATLLQKDLDALQKWEET